MGKLTVEVAHWHAVATWTWDAGDDVCGAKLCIIPYCLYNINNINVGNRCTSEFFVL